MSHILRKINLGNSVLAEATIVDYVAGGEAFTLAELGLTGNVVSVAFLAIIGQPDTRPVLQSGKVVLMVGHGEMRSTTGVNFSFVAIVHGT